MNSILIKSSNFICSYGSRDAFFRTIQNCAKLLSLLLSENENEKKKVLIRIANLLGTSRKYFSIGNFVKEINNLKISINSSHENPEYLLRCLKSGGMLGFFAMDNLNAVSSLTVGKQISYIPTIGNLSFLVAVLSSIGLEYIKEEKEDDHKKYVRYGRIASDLLIVLNSLNLIKLPESVSTVTHLISASLCCVEALQN